MSVEAKDGIEGLNLFIGLHQAQLVSSGVPEIFWPTLYHKLKHGIFDAGQSFGLGKLEPEEDDDHIPIFNLWKVMVYSSGGLSASNPENIFLVDHAWTFRPEQARSHLRSIPGLLDRMLKMIGIENMHVEQDDMINSVLQEMWKYCQTYSIANPNLEAEERVPIWYIMDEFGSHIQHSDNPNVRLVPFFYMNEQATYSLLFPITNIKEEEEVTRDFVEGCSTDPVHRAALLMPWNDELLCQYSSSVSLEQEEPEPGYFTASRLNETFPLTDQPVPELPQDRPIKTYVEYTFIREFLKHPRFQLVDNPEEAEILWLSSHFKDFRKLSEDSPHKRINQFPCEHLLTVKDLNCIIARRSRDVPRVDPETLETQPKWLPVTFNMKTELAKLIAFYTAQKEKGMSNYWIIKPWNLARSLDTHITDNLDQILRLAVSGPKICQKYIDRPVLFHREELAAKVKFDVRYIVLLRSVEPLKVYAYDRFWLRFANKPFELDHFDEYERHFTVMNYTATNLHQMFCHDFVRHFEEQNPGQSWKKIEKRIFAMLADLFRAACKGDNPSTSLKSAPQSRAMYAVDLMLSWTDEGLDDERGPSIQPKLLELNWAPDCKRACNYYPEFFDDVFSVLFLDETEGKHVSLLE